VDTFFRRMASRARRCIIIARLSLTLSIKMRTQHHSTSYRRVKQAVIPWHRHPLRRSGSHQRAEIAGGSRALFAMSASFRGKASTGTIGTSTSHGISVLTVGCSNGPQHDIIYTQSISREITRESHSRRRRLGLAATCRQVRRETFEGQPHSPPV